MNIAIIGAGSCGEAAAREWSALGHRVSAATVNPEHLAAVAPHCVRAELARGSDEPAIRRLLEGQDAVVVSLAGSYAQAAAGDLDDWLDSYLGTSACIARILSGNPGIRHIVAMSSTNTYGPAGGVSICSEDVSPTPVRPQDDIVNQADSTYLSLASPDRSAAVLMVGHIYGPPPHDVEAGVRRNPGKALPYPYDSAVSLIHRDDVVGATLHIIEHNLSGRFNLLDDTLESRGDFYGRQARARGLGEPTWKPNGGLPTQFPNAKLKATGYAFRHPRYAD